MKQFLNFFYIAPFKLLLVILICLSCIGINLNIAKITKLYKEDPASVSNVFVQGKDYDYFTSVHLKKEIESTIQTVLNYCFMVSEEDVSDYKKSDKYVIDTIIYLAKSYVEDKTVDEYFIDSGFITLTEKPAKDSNTVEIDGKHYVQSVNEKTIRLTFNQKKDGIIDKYRMYTDEEYNRTVTALSEIKDLHFAVVNHSKDTIISDIDEINGKPSNENIRKHFKGNEKNLLIVHSVHNPYFEKGTMTQYVEFVYEFSEKYEDNFDLYISFNENLTFPTSSEEYAQRHQTTFEITRDYVYQALILLSINLLLTVILIKVTGRRQYKGDIILATSDKIPNDLLHIPLLTIFISVLALYQLSLYMAIKPEEAYFFNISSDMYILRAIACSLILQALSLSALASIKRQSDNKSLFTNTYVYRFIKRFYKTKDKP